MLKFEPRPISWVQAFHDQVVDSREYVKKAADQIPVEIRDAMLFQGFGCSWCPWRFSPTGMLAGDSLDEMKGKFEAERDKEFAAHACVKRRSPTDQIAK